jgi:coenzyme F420-reducing hydrogenase beta subunit
MKSPIISQIVEKDLCVGCGVCVAVCPNSTLEMTWNRYGEYNPREVIPCETECGLCLKVCPFADGNDNEDVIGKGLYGNIPAIRHRPETGYYLASYVGHAPATRDRGASGGMATWLLSSLLKNNIVDYVIAVVPNDDPERLFKFSILNDHASVLSSSGSAYYPVTLSEVLREIQNKPGKCAVIGLPCFIKAVRLACQRNRKLSDKILFTLGIVCGQLKSKYYTEYIATLAGIKPPLQNVHYRGKSPEKPASNYYFSCTNKEGSEGKIFWDQGVAEAWLNRWFTPNACNYCDDVFAECADITFMDAWLPEYSSEPKGTSLVLVRSEQLQKIIVDGIASGEINLKPIPIQKIIESQTGGLVEKRINLAHRLYLNEYKGYFTPQKRVKPKKITGLFRKKRISITNQMRITSRDIWAEQHSNGSYDIKKFRDQMNSYLAQISRLDRFSTILVLPLKIINASRRKIRRYLHG